MTAGAGGGEPARAAAEPWTWLAPGDLPLGTVELARALVGAVLVSAEGGLAAARIVETEAYVPGDAASHAFRGRTARNAAMFGPPWRAYVYFIYGVWFCLNVASEAEGTGAAVLLRAAEPVAGLETMRARRPGASDRDLCRGPGRLATALGVGREANGLDLLAPGPLRLAASPGPPLAPLRAGGRIGLTREAERPLRFYAWPCEHVSGTRRGNGA